MQKTFSAPGLAWQAASKKTKVKLDLLTDLNMLLMVDLMDRFRGKLQDDQ